MALISRKILTLVIVGVMAASAAPVLAQDAEPPDAIALRSVDPDAVAAARRMGNALRMLTSFEVRTTASVEEVVDDDGTKITIDWTNLYRVRRPDAFYVEARSAGMTREFWYDGSQFTVALPRRGFYAQTAAPATIQGVLDDAYDRFGIALPLADIFTWGVVDLPEDILRVAVKVGDARIGDVETEQYLFETDALAWQVWIPKSEQALPAKIVITTLDEPGRPSYTALLDWTPSARFASTTFTYVPPTAARPIAMATIQ